MSQPRVLHGGTTFPLRTLCLHDRRATKKVVEKTQFPIESSAGGFKGRRNSSLKGVSNEHIAAIQRLQPFEGCDWTAVLRDLSNPDKHKHLTVVPSPVVITPNPDPTEAISGDVSIEIFFGDRLPVVKTLEEIASEVAAVLDSFKAEFE